MLKAPHEDLEKLNPVHAQSDIGCYKGQRPFFCFKYGNNFFWIVFTNPSTLLIQDRFEFN